jgi:TatA/E family protein of Tat protein translocase
MFDIGLQELLLIMVIALLVFGPKRLPELGRAIGRATREFRRASEEFRSTIETNIMAQEPPTALVTATPEPPPVDVKSTEALPDSVLYPHGASDESSQVESVSAPSLPTEPFVAKRDARLYHSRECGWTQRIPEADRLYFKRIADAREQGFQPCPVCAPWEPQDG